MTPLGTTRAGIAELVGHDPYKCDDECCKSHETAHCQRCGEDRGDDHVVMYILGCEVACLPNSEAYGPRTEPDKWIVWCGPCDDRYGWS